MKRPDSSQTEKKSLEDLVELLADKDRKTRIKAIHSIGEFRNGGQAREAKAQRALMAILESGSPIERHLAASYLRSGQAVPTLIKALKDQHYYVRSSAARRLGNIGDKSAIIPLREMLEHEGESRMTKLAAAIALAQLNDNFGATVIEQALREEDDSNPYRQVAEFSLNYLKIKFPLT